jgi:hypothetical protein
MHGWTDGRINPGWAGFLQIKPPIILSFARGREGEKASNIYI